VNTKLLEEAKALSLADRVKMFDALWDNLVQEGYEPELTEAQKRELGNRLEAYRKFLEAAQGWETMKNERKRESAGL
jgi:putative addiction module component (TIGR02574 family)